jgi:hypothetical protein
MHFKAKDRIAVDTFASGTNWSLIKAYLIATVTTYSNLLDREAATKRANLVKEGKKPVFSRSTLEKSGIEMEFRADGAVLMRRHYSYRRGQAKLYATYRHVREVMLMPTPSQDSVIISQHVDLIPSNGECISTMVKCYAAPSLTHSKDPKRLDEDLLNDLMRLILEFLRTESPGAVPLRNLALQQRTPPKQAA